MLVSLLHLFLNLTLAGATACLLLPRLGGRGLAVSVEARLGGGFLLVVGQVCLLALVLGYLGVLTAATLTLGQVVLLSGAMLVTRRIPTQPASSIPDMNRIHAGASPAPSCLCRSERLCLLFLVVVGLGLLAVNLALEPLDFDSVGYRLSRIGLWLQDGRLAQVPTNDARMNYTSLNGDLLMLWLTSPFARGYPLTGLPQFAGALALLIATLGFARLMGLNATVRLCLAALLLTMPVFIGQAMTTQVDLFFAGTLAVSLLWLYLSLQKGAPPWIAWIGLGLSLGTKGSFFYMAPGLLALGLLWLLTRRPPARDILRQTLAAVVFLILLGAPRYMENQLHYGNPFAPQEEIDRIHGQEAAGFSWDKLGLNLFSYAVEPLAPNANPPLVDEATGPVLLALSERVLGDDPYTFAIGRKDFYQALCRGEIMNEISLQASWGVLASVLAAAGLTLAVALAVRRRLSRDAALILLGLGLAMGGYVLAFSGLFNWSQDKYRFFLPAVPLLLLAAGLLIQRLSPRGQRLCLIALCAYAALGLTKFTTDSAITGLRGLADPQYTSVGKTLALQRHALEADIPAGARLAVCLPYYSPLSPFFRTPQGVHTVLVTPEQLAAYPSAEAFLNAEGFDVLIAPPDAYAGRTGAVYARSASPRRGHHAFMNFVLYRPLSPGEQPDGFILRGELTFTNEGKLARYAWEIVPASSEPVTLRLVNTAPTPLLIRINGGTAPEPFVFELPAGKGYLHPLPQDGSPSTVRIDTVLPVPAPDEATAGDLPLRVDFPALTPPY